MMLEKPVMSKTSLTCGCIRVSTSFPWCAVTFFCSCRKTRKPCDEVYSMALQSISMSGCGASINTATSFWNWSALVVSTRPSKVTEYLFSS